MAEQSKLELGRETKRGKDLFLCHTGADKPWVERLAERIEAEPYQDRHLGVVFDKWDFAKGSNIVLDIEREIDACRCIGVVVTKAMLSADWPTLERTIAVWSDPSGVRGRVIPLLRENVTLPPSLRVRNWIDFRDDSRFDEAVGELVRFLRGEAIPRGRGGLLPTVPEVKLPYEPAPVVITSSTGADVVQERLVSNLFPVLELPSTSYGAETLLRHKAEVVQCCQGRCLPPFVLRKGKLFTFAPLDDNQAPFLEAIRTEKIYRETFREWLGHPDRRRWAIELLNVSLKEYAWRRYLRFEKIGRRYFFSPYKNQPKRLRWRVGGKWTGREVTTPHMGRKKLDDGRVMEFQRGWRHQGIRASFLLLPFGLFLRIEPTWLLTKIDGRTPRGGPYVGPVLSRWLNQERNGQILRALRFWSLVLARGRNEIEIPTGQGPIRIGLAPASGFLGFGILGDRIDYDGLMNSEIEDDIAVPQLSLFPEHTGIPHEEDGEESET
jgi:hypothetical protein